MPLVHVEYSLLGTLRYKFARYLQICLQILEFDS